MDGFVDTLDYLPNTFELEVLDTEGKRVSYSKTYNSRVQAGAAAVAQAMFAGTGISFKYFALSNSSGLTPANTDTTLAGEITTLGLGRQAASMAIGSTTSGLNATIQTVATTSWTATGATTIYGGALFSAASSGTLGFEATCTATPVANTYTVNATWTLNE
jgi:hypothetical protein